VQAIKAQRRRSRIASLILNLNTRWRSVIVSCPTHFTSREGTPQYPLTNRLGRNKRHSGHFGEQKHLLPLPEIEPQIVQHIA
jgi:hypothetical protein